MNKVELASWTYIDKVDIVGCGVHHCPECHLISDLSMELSYQLFPSLAKSLITSSKLPRSFITEIRGKKRQKRGEESQEEGEGKESGLPKCFHRLGRAIAV